eukprot:2963695-Pyramimonas_sp.AAC.1
MLRERVCWCIRQVSAKIVLARGRIGNGRGLKLTYRVHGGEANVDSGIHVHAGTSCSVPEGMFSDANPNAWLGVTYQTDAHGNGEGSFEIETGFAIEENEGKVVTIHDAKGGALACGVLHQGPNQILEKKRKVTTQDL